MASCQFEINDFLGWLIWTIESSLALMGSDFCVISYDDAELQGSWAWTG